MDEKSYHDSVTPADVESSGDHNSASVEKMNEQNDSLIESLTDETESKSLDKKAKPDNAFNQPETVASLAEVPAPVSQEKAEPDKIPEYGTLQFESDDGDDAEEIEKETHRNTEDIAYDRGGVDTEDEVIENAVQSDSRETDENEAVKGSPEENEAIAERDEYQEETGDVEDDDPLVQTRVEAETAGAEEKTDDVAAEGAFESPTAKPSVLKVVVSAILITAAFCGFFLFENKSKVKATSQKALNTSENREISTKRHKRTEVHKPITSKTGSIYDAKIEELTALRDSLLLKQKEVMRLKKQYHDGIEELEKEISDELQKGGITTFLQAIGDSAVVYTLKAIQRRQAYVQQLERPSRWIQQACEELLYLKRRTMLDIEVAEIAAGVDLNRNVRLINAAVRKYQPTAAKLALDRRDAQLEPLENIWKRVHNKTQQYASVRAHSKNQIIAEQICTGNFSRLSELSEISRQTASCITEMRSSDLFLNGLTEISPAAARQLFQWKGTWICLNGVRALSARAAHYLFQWDGSWISLNGLTEFPAEIGEKLLQWDGNQLELMGLQYREDFPSRIALKYLARWEHAGGKLFVPEAVRKKLDEIHAEST